MNIWLGAAVVAATTTFASPAPGALGPKVPASASVTTAAFARNDALRSYTFHLDVDMAMRSFPWFHFRMEGSGDYRRGDHYLVHITKRPGFASQMHDLDLSLIDPNMWPGRFRYHPVGRQNDATIFSLQGLQKNDELKSASVAMDPILGARWVDATYTDGMHVRMVITSNDVAGFLLPTSLTADVNYPHMFPFSASASFSDYSILDPQIVPRPDSSSSAPP
jgi:hypothetical protein